MESIHVICTTWSYEEIKKVSQEPYGHSFSRKDIYRPFEQGIYATGFFNFCSLGLEGKNAFLH